MAATVILAIDTSAAHCAAALLWADGATRRSAAHAEPMDKGQAERLVPMIGELMARESVAWADITTFAVGTGPGNFTGIRIAVALARGLALGRGIPAIGVTGFEAASFAAPRPHWVVIPAPRQQVYVQRCDGLHHAATIIDAAAVAALDAPVVSLAALTPEDLATAIANVALAKAGVPQPRPAPFYLRGADAAPPTDPPPVILDALP